MFSVNNRATAACILLISHVSQLMSAKLKTMHSLPTNYFLHFGSFEQEHVFSYTSNRNFSLQSSLGVPLISLKQIPIRNLEYFSFFDEKNNRLLLYLSNGIAEGLRTFLPFSNGRLSSSVELPSRSKPHHRIFPSPSSPTLSSWFENHFPPIRLRIKGFLMSFDDGAIMT